MSDAPRFQLGGFLQKDAWHDTHRRQTVLQSVEQAAREAISPLERLEVAPHPWVSFVIMPLFAFANAGVPIEAGTFTDSVAMAVVVGLYVGKPIGIVLFSWFAVRTGLAKLPEGISWAILAAGGVLAGIGFTMALFIAGLAFSERLLLAAKVGILTGSALCAAGVGAAALTSAEARTAWFSSRLTTRRVERADLYIDWYGVAQRRRHTGDLKC